MDSSGVLVNASSEDAIAVTNPGSFGLKVKGAGKDGIRIEESSGNGVSIVGSGHSGISVRKSGKQAFEIHSPASHAILIDSTGLAADGVHVNYASDDGFEAAFSAYGFYANTVSYNGCEIAYPGRDGVHVYGAARRGGFFHTSSDTSYALYVTTEDSTQPGLFVNGTAFSTGGWHTKVKTSKGAKALTTVTSSSEDIVSSGRGLLVDGRAKVVFEELFSEALSLEVPLAITLTPIGGWSALYVEEVGEEGFVVKSQAGKKNCDFSWTATGRRNGCEKKRRLRIPEAKREKAEIEGKKAG